MSGPVLLHLLRHGAPTLPGRLLGRTDIPATSAGIDACVARASGLDIAAIVSSDLARAIACAGAIAAQHELSVTVDPRWRELDFGAWDGLATDGIDAAALARFWDDPDGQAPPGGERWASLTNRVGAALAVLPDRALVVTHGGAMRAALAVACGFAFRECWAFDLPYAARLSLRLWRGDAPAAQIVALVA